MLPIDTGTSILNALSRKDIPDYEKDELTLCREAASRGNAGRLLASLVPSFLASLLRRRVLRMELHAAVLRLAETSPHLLRDIGILEGVDIDEPMTAGARAGVEVVRPYASTTPRPVIRPVDAPIAARTGLFAHT